MVEQGIYFALGCIVTALAALMFAPAFWRRALRLTRKRLQLQVPLSMQEILAERDQLRAEFAVERLRIEQSAERVHATKAADMAEIGRRSLEAAALRGDLAATHDLLTARDREIVGLERDVAESSAAHGALHQAIVGAEARADLWRRRADDSAADGDLLRDDIEQHRTTIAGLKTRAMGLEMRLTDTERAGAVRLQQLEDGLHKRLEAAMAQSTRHESSAIDLRRERDDAKARIRTLEAELQHALSHAQSLDLRGAEIGRRLEAAIAQSSANEGRAADLGRERDDAQSRILALESEVAQARDHAQSLDRRSAEIATHLETALTHAKAQDESASDLHRRHDEAKERIATLEGELARAHEQARTLDRRGADIGARLEAAVALARQQETGATARGQERDEATARLHALEAELDHARSQISSLGRQGAEAGVQLQAAITQGRTHEDSLAGLRHDLSDAEARVRTLEADLERARGREQALQLQASLRDRRGPSSDVDPVDGSDADLRASIHALGVAVAKMMRASGGPPNDPIVSPRPARTSATSRVDAN